MVSSDSDGHEVLAHRGWHLHVSTGAARHRRNIMYSRHLTCSWEFVTTLNYEWNVFRGHQRYRWTIWVRDDSTLL